MNYIISHIIKQLYKTVPLVTVMLMKSYCFGQTFNIRPELNNNTIIANVWETEYGYLTSGLVLDTVGPLHSEFFTAGFSFTGEQLFQKFYGEVNDGYFPFNDANVQLDDSTFVFASEHFINGIMHAALIWINDQGDTLQTRNYPSPYSPDEPDDQTNWMVPTYLALNSLNEIYMSCQIFKPSTANDFCVMKILPDWEVDWIYINATNSLVDACQSMLCDETNGLILGGGHTEPGDENSDVIEIIHLTQTGIENNSFTDDEFGFDPSYVRSMLIDENNLIISGAIANPSDDVEVQPLIFKIDQNGQWVDWTVSPGWEFYPDQNVEHLEWASDGGLVALGHQYEHFSEPDFVDGYYNWNAWLVKCDEEGIFEWQRFYHFVESTNDQHKVYDMKTTSDGGFIFCGEATDLCSGEDCDVSQQGWLVKVDEYGCLVPGCQVGILENEETVNFLVGPNPANDFLNIYLETANNVSGIFSLYDMEGRLVRSFEAKQSGVTYITDVSNLPSGVYVLSFVANNGNAVKKKIVVH